MRSYRHDAVHAQRSRRRGIILLILLIAVLAAAGVSLWTLLHDDTDGRVSDPNDATSAEQHEASPNDVSIANITSGSDYNRNGQDDYSDIVAGAREEAKRHPTYDDGYYTGGYPPENRGACTDLVWRAFKQAGYDLKAMVDADITAHPEHYPDITAPDPNIDFRRAGTLGEFFAAYGTTLTNDIKPGDIGNLKQWQPGDLVVFDHGKHIAVVSSARNAQGVPLVIHNNHQQGPFEEDYLSHHTRRQITGHYRFDATKIPTDVLRPWQ